MIIALNIVFCETGPWPLPIDQSSFGVQTETKSFLWKKYLGDPDTQAPSPRQESDHGGGVVK